MTEFRAGGATSANLSTTEISGATAVITGSGRIAPTIVGRGGRKPPRTVIDDDTVGDVEQDSVFDPREDGLDFYESLEGMLTEVRKAVAIAPTTDFGSNRELPVLADGGAGATVRARRGPLVVRRGDMNPERIILNDANDPGGAFLPIADVGDRFKAPVRAVVDYSFGNFKFLAVNDPRFADGGLRPETTRKRGRDELAVASYNVENLDGVDEQERFDRVADQIVGNLRSPDILSLEEIQDNDGAATTTPTQANLTYERLIDAIAAAGGPTYDYRQIDPEPGTDGGEPGGNIRVAFLFRTDVRGLRFVDRPGGDATTATEPVAGARGARLTLSPGRVDPTNDVFDNSRKPLAGEFRYRGKPLFVVGNHFNSKGGDDPLFGRFQAPRRSERGRAARAGGGAQRLRARHPRPRPARPRGRARRPQRLRLLGDAAGGRAGHERAQPRAGEPVEPAAPPPALLLHLPGQRSGPGPHPRQPGAAATRPAGLRARPHQHGVRRPGLRPRPADRALQASLGSSRSASTPRWSEPGIVDAADRDHANAGVGQHVVDGDERGEGLARRPGGAQRDAGLLGGVAVAAVEQAPQLGVVERRVEVARQHARRPRPGGRQRPHVAPPLRGRARIRGSDDVDGDETDRGGAGGEQLGGREGEVGAAGREPSAAAAASRARCR